MVPISPYNPPRATSKQQLAFENAYDTALMWSFSRCPEEDLRCRDRVPPMITYQTSRELDLSGHRQNEEITYSPTMNHVNIEFRPRLKNDCERAGMCGSTYSLNSSYRDENLRHLKSPPEISTRFQVHDKFQTIFQAYDNEMLSKLDSGRKNDNIKQLPCHSKSSINSTVQDASTVSNSTHNVCSQQSLSFPEKTNKSLAAIHSFKHRPERTVIPTSQNHGLYSSDIRLPNVIIDHRKLSSSFFPNSESRSRVNNSSLSNGFRKCHIQSIFPKREDEYQKESNLKQLLLENCDSSAYSYSPVIAGGKKRRANTPIEDERDSLYNSGSSNRSFQNLESTASNCSAGPSFHSHSRSLSSTTSDTRNNSYASTTDSGASINSTGMISPSCISPSCISPRFIDDKESSSATSLSMNPIPPETIFRPGRPKNSSLNCRTYITSCSTSNSDDQATQNTTTSNARNVFLCECCPKKPKMFDSKADLDAHEQEKQYECAYCRNRFKNKNEAERHQNSLHLRRHSWSCAALSSYAAAFYESLTQPTDADTCGYCGEEFSRSGMISGLPVATEQDWANRVAHLTEMHKFRECNHAKKFFRADHFRQHLKHSHAGTSGRWTNMLENSCMKDEPFPEPIQGPDKNTFTTCRISKSHNERVALETVGKITSLGRSSPNILKVT